MKIKILLENKEQFLAPTKGTEKSAAYDLYVQEDVVIKKGRQVVPCGFAIELDPDTAAEIRPRSGYSSKGMEGYEIIGKMNPNFNPMHPREEEPMYLGEFANLKPSRFDADVLLGLVDEDYRDGVGVIVKNYGDKFLIKRGTRIAQMLIVDVPKTEIEIAEELSESNRKGGFGSTGA